MDILVGLLLLPLQLIRCLCERRTDCTSTGVIPLGLWALLKWSGSEAANILECWALYGYANLIWIPVALISWSPVDSTFSPPRHSLHDQLHTLTIITRLLSTQLHLRRHRPSHICTLPLPQPVRSPRLSLAYTKLFHGI